MNDADPRLTPFVRACLANPDDATPRLIFADHLEEQGDPRAAWLRVVPTTLDRLGPPRIREDCDPRRVTDLVELARARRWTERRHPPLRWPVLTFARLCPNWGHGGKNDQLRGRHGLVTLFGVAALRDGVRLGLLASGCVTLAVAELAACRLLGNVEKQRLVREALRAWAVNSDPQSWSWPHVGLRHAARLCAGPGGRALAVIDNVGPWCRLRGLTPPSPYPDDDYRSVRWRFAFQTAAVMSRKLDLADAWRTVVAPLWESARPTRRAKPGSKLGTVE